MWSIHDAVGLLRSKQLSATELLNICAQRIVQHNDQLNAFVHLDLEGAAVLARTVDGLRANGIGAGPLAGVPFGVKDLEDCEGMPTTRGSRWYAGGPPAERDDIHVARLRRAGAVPVGKTAAPEFGAWAYTASPALGVTRSPWNPIRTPGGSSGGSSAAVSSGMVPFCTASDGGGSIRTPAAFTGLPGLKPCYGRVPTFGVTHAAQNAVNFALATTIADTALLLDVCAGPDPRDRTCLPSPVGSYLSSIEAASPIGAGSADGDPLRIAWSADLGFAVVDPEVAAIAHRAAATLIDAIGARSVDADIRLRDYIGIYVRMEGLDRWIDLPDGLWPDRADELDPLVRPGWDAGQHVTLPELARTYSARRRLEHEIAALFDRIDVLVTPMASVPAFDAGGPMPTTVAGQTVHGGMAVVLGMLANLCNLPAISLPAGTTADGMPVGLQVIAPRFREDLCLWLGRRLEQAAPWPRLAPGCG